MKDLESLIDKLHRDATMFNLACRVESTKEGRMSLFIRVLSEIFKGELENENRGEGRSSEG
jgi:hypothetical protein